MSNYKIREDKLEELAAKLETLQNKMSRLCDDCRVNLIIHGQEVINGQMFFQVEVSGQLPPAGDWDYIARLEFDAETGQNIIFVRPGKTDADLPGFFRTSGTDCDHCNLSRRRKKIYVLYNEGAGFKQVGSTCVNDFTGTLSAENIARAAELLESAVQSAERAEDESAAASDFRPRWLPLDNFLNHVALVIRLTGYYKSRAKYGDEATADGAFINLQDLAENKGWAVAPTAADKAQALAALKWVRTTWAKEESEALNDYQHNLVTVCSGDYINHRHIGIAASLLSVYLRETAAPQKPSVWIGEVGKRLRNLPVTCIFSTCFDSGQWGDRCINKFVDAAGNELVWFTSWCAEQGQQYQLTATVKEHGDYKGRQQTIVTRAKLETL